MQEKSSVKINKKKNNIIVDISKINSLGHLQKMKFKYGFDFEKCEPFDVEKFQKENEEKKGILPQNQKKENNGNFLE